MLNANRLREGSLAPVNTRDAMSGHVDFPSEQPSLAASITSLTSEALSRQTSRDEKIHNDFEQGGIRLKKRPSTNFGVPFGQLGGLGGVRKMS
jgi:hypothetical protein